MPDIESRWPLVADPKTLKKITATLKGKLPPSSHALADMLDSAAQTKAVDDGLRVLATAGPAVEGEEADTYEETVDKVVSERDPKNPKKKIEKTVQVAETRTRKVPTLSRDYWCIPAA